MKWVHNDYSEEALFEMQQEAEKRVREMQSRARLLVDPKTPEPPSPPGFSSFLSHEPPNNLLTPVHSTVNSRGLPFLDGDLPIILVLLWILWNEHADANLLLALIYLLL